MPTHVLKEDVHALGVPPPQCAHDANQFSLTQTACMYQTAEITHHITYLHQEF